MIVQILDVSFCGYSSSELPSGLGTYDEIPQFILGVTLFILAVMQTLKQSVRMYTATKQWQPNRYMQQFLRDGVLYFLVTLFFNITSMLQSMSSIFDSTLILVLNLLSNITLYPMIPRFIISVRELYDRDLRGRWDGIDTGFGVRSQPIASQDAVVSAIAFADVAPGRDEVVEGDANEPEVIRLETLGGNTRQV